MRSSSSPHGPLIGPARDSYRRGRSKSLRNARDERDPQRLERLHLGGCGKTSFRIESVTSAAEAVDENKPVIAAVNRCATQKQMQCQVFPQAAGPLRAASDWVTRFWLLVLSWCVQRMTGRFRVTKLTLAVQSARVQRIVFLFCIGVSFSN
jgi:hypothetical protein